MDEEDPESSFSCDRCGFCCQFDVVLYPEDIVRIKRSGHTAFYKTRGGEQFLKHKRGFCLFYDTKNHSCNIYESRPRICRLFPFKTGSLSSKCKQKKDFSSKIQQHIIEFMNEDNR